MCKYVNADELTQVIRGIMVSGRYGNLYKVLDFLDALEWVCDVIGELSVLEVKHGEWINHTEYGVTSYITDKDVECSECGHRQPRLFDMNFCPNCGADMRGEAE